MINCINPKMKKLVLIALVVGCGSDASPEIEPISMEGIVPGCMGMEILHDDECVVPSKAVFVSVTATSPSLPAGFGAPRLCTEVLRADEADARSFVTFHQVLEQTDECLVVLRVPDTLQTPWPYAGDPDGFESVVIRRDSDEWVLDTAELFEGCVSIGTTLFTAFEFGATYQVDVPTGGADTTYFPTTIAIPEDPQQVCPVVAPGEPLEFVWSASGANSVRISVRVGDVAINCASEDTGEFTISAELTSLLPESGRQVVEVRARNIEEHYNPETKTLTTFVGEALGSCR